MAYTKPRSSRLHTNHTSETCCPLKSAYTCFFIFKGSHIQCTVLGSSYMVAPKSSIWPWSNGGSPQPRQQARDAQSATEDHTKPNHAFYAKSVLHNGIRGHTCTLMFKWKVLSFILPVGNNFMQEYAICIPLFQKY